jgi:hypothetical protein
VAFHLAIFASTYISAILTGSVAWQASTHWYNQTVTGIPLVQAGDLMFTEDPVYLDTFLEYSIAVSTIFYVDNPDSTSMHRILPDYLSSLPNGSRFDETTVPFFAVDAFEWIKNPKATLSSSQLALATATNNTGPRVMNVLKWGLLPDKIWGLSDSVFPAPRTISESRILVIDLTSSHCIVPTLPSDVQLYNASLGDVSSCFIFANVTYRAGAARSGRCQISGPGVLQDVGDVKGLQLVEDSATSTGLALAPYVSTTLVWDIYVLPGPPHFRPCRTNPSKFSQDPTRWLGVSSRRLWVRRPRIVPSWSV